MKTNIFNVKEKNDKKIILEEERTKNPFLLFLKQHKKFLLFTILMIIICLLLATTGIAFALFKGTNDYDISYIEGSEQINTNQDPTINDDDIKDELLGEVSRTNGIIILVEKFMTTSGDVIYYYTDGTSVVVKSNGKIYRISTNQEGEYGIDRNGQIDKTAKKVLVTSTNSALSDGTIITYYSDGSAKIELKNETLFLRDSNNLKTHDGQTLNYLDTSKVSLELESTKLSNDILYTFTDNTSLVIINNQKYIINKNTMPTTNSGKITYDVNNAFSTISEKTYSDGNTITHFANGSAVITDSQGNVIYVAKSGDLTLKNDKLYEISPNDYGFSRTSKNSPDGRNITYFDNGAAIIINTDGTREYVEDSSDIIYDVNNNIQSNPTTSSQKSLKTTTDNEKVINFTNGKSQVIKQDGTSYITDTNKLTFKTTGEIANKPTENTTQTTNPGEGIVISDAEHKYNDFKNVESTTFIIKNNNNKKKSLRIAIEEVKNYQTYQTTRLDPKYVKFQATINDDYVSATNLNANTWIDSDNVTNYIIYDGTLGAKSTVNVTLSLYVDYAELTNAEQNKAFIGTIKVYIDN